MESYPIGILDSGIGGVTVLKEILKLLPNENYIYYSDSIHNPYGEKTKEVVFSYVDEIINFFISKKCKIIIIACNTATALTVEEIRKKYPSLIIIGIEPAYKKVYDNAREKRTLVMATPATIQSERFQKLYHKYDNHNTILLPCTGLANLIEQEDKKTITSYLKDKLPKNENIEVVVLGCTHYPLIKDEIKSILGDVIFYDGGMGIALRLKNILEENEIPFNNNGSIKFYDSSNNQEKEIRFYEMLKN